MNENIYRTNSLSEVFFVVSHDGGSGELNILGCVNENIMFLSIQMYCNKIHHQLLI